MNFVKLGAVLVVGAVTIALSHSSSAFAASAITKAFLANLQPNIAFLDQSSRIASNQSESAAIREFARVESVEQTQFASDLGHLMPLIASTDGDMRTGRSVAVDGGTDVASTTANQAANGRAPLVQQDIEKLAILKGKAFDDLYWQKQLDALSQIEADYRAYIANGDDPALVSIAKQELPKIIHRLELLSKI